jgi:hypothetical protein
MVVGGIIGAVVSAIQGGSWLSDKIDAAHAASAGGKSGATSQTAANTSPFEAALAAQAAGQSLPSTTGGLAAISSPTLSAAIVPATHGTDYDSLARMKAGIMAYSHIGEHRAKSPSAVDGSVSPS